MKVHVDRQSFQTSEETEESIIYVNYFERDTRRVTELTPSDQDLNCDQLYVPGIIPCCTKSDSADIYYEYDPKRSFSEKVCGY